MYSLEDHFLYEIIEDYQEETDPEKKQEIFDAFMAKLWSVPLRRRKYTKYLCFKMDENVSEEMAAVFRQFAKIPYVAYVSKTRNQDPWYLLRQKINNIYTFLCDPEICFKKDYMKLLSSAKTYYYRYINGELHHNAQQLFMVVDNHLTKAAALKTSYEKQKILISWSQYKRKIAQFMLRIFQNYIPMEQLCVTKQLNFDIDFWSEENYVVKYIGKSLCGYMKNYQKEYLHLKQHRRYGVCSCGRLFEKHNNRHKYCDFCARQKVQEYDRSRKTLLRSM